MGIQGSSNTTSADVEKKTTKHSGSVGASTSAKDKDMKDKGAAIFRYQDSETGID